MIKYKMQSVGGNHLFKLQNNTKKKCNMQLNGENEMSDTCLLWVDLFCYAGLCLEELNLEEWKVASCVPY